MHVHYMFIAVKIPRKKYIFGKVAGNFYTITVYIYVFSCLDYSRNNIESISQSHVLPHDRLSDTIKRKIAYNILHD